MLPSTAKLEAQFAELAPLRRVFARADALIEAAAHRLSSSENREAVEDAEDRLLAAQTTAFGLYGKDALPNWDEVQATDSDTKLSIHHSCSDFLRLAVQAVDAACETVDRLIQTFNQGAWLGSFPLSFETIESATRMTGWTGAPSVEVTLRPEYRAALDAFTTRFVDKTVGRVCHIRLDGRVVLRPPVYEPLSRLSLIGLEQEDADVFIKSVSCPLKA